jgi:hypothetical protein
VAIDPAQAAAGGAVGSVLLMLIVRFLLRQFGEIPVDRKRAAADGARAEAESAVHDGYRQLVKDFRDEIDRLHNEVRRMKASIDDARTAIASAMRGTKHEPAKCASSKRNCASVACYEHTDGIFDAFLRPFRRTPAPAPAPATPAPPLANSDRADHARAYACGCAAHAERALAAMH